MAQPPWHHNRKAVIATMHQKERVIAPLFTEAFALSTVVPFEFDTNRFGTFTRDIERPGSQLETARAKAEAALSITGETLAIASEGSFGPHAKFPWVAADLELVLLLDRQHGFEVHATHLSLETNYAHKDVETIEEAIAFAKKAQFPSHGLVLSSTAKPDAVRTKGIEDWEVLHTEFEKLLAIAPSGKVHIETDMRAMYNPQRMAVIQQATEQLIQKLQQTCPACHYPGFSVIKTISGLPCQWCSTPTSLPLKEILGCQHCEHQVEQMMPSGQAFADPGRCFVCNP